jgi:hemolysin-activating ACP:hemolysin acyltransferase
VIQIERGDVELKHVVVGPKRRRECCLKAIAKPRLALSPKKQANLTGTSGAGQSLAIPPGVMVGTLTEKAAMTPFHAVMTAVPVPPHMDLKVMRPQNPYVALGLAVSHMMTKPAFANLRFGDWSRILTGQINRKHYYFAVDGKNQIQGFVGWALTSREKAEAWIEGRGALSFGDSLEGDCVIVNAWSASTPEANRFLVSQGREIVEGKDTVYFKRHYKDGRTRAVRLRVKDFVAQHLRGQSSSVRGFRQPGNRPLD